jgi:hypothetical protein
VLAPPTLRLVAIQYVDVKIRTRFVARIPQQIVHQVVVCWMGPFRDHPQDIVRTACEEPAERVEEASVRRPQFTVVLQVPQQRSIDACEPPDIAPIQRSPSLPVPFGVHFVEPLADQVNPPHPNSPEKKLAKPIWFEHNRLLNLYGLESAYPPDWF